MSSKTRKKKLSKDNEKDKTSIEKQLGENIELVGFEENSTEERGLTSTSFNFDGKYLTNCIQISSKK